MCVRGWGRGGYPQGKERLEIWIRWVLDSDVRGHRCFQAGQRRTLEIHICWKVDRDARMEPPIQTEYLRSGGATTFIR